MGNSKYKDLEPTEFDGINTYELKTRPSKVTVEDFGKPIVPEMKLDEFLSGLPNLLGAESLNKIALRIVRASERGKPIIWGIGGHVIKTGMAPILIDLMEKGYVTAIAANGSVLVHDSEIARAGFTSEDVDATLGAGDFGAARETGELLNTSATRALKDKIGLGEAVSRELHREGPEFARVSLLCSAYSQSVPVTSHITIGADIGHFHPSADGGALGEASHRDFKLFTTLVREMNGGGVYLNIGSAVTMPEIFLKAVTVNRNLGYELSDLTTANFDFIQHYRPITNVVRRPNANGAGKGFSITGHHELMLPLLAASILSVK
jgi:hypothetical protein